MLRHFTLLSPLLISPFFHPCSPTPYHFFVCNVPYDPFTLRILLARSRTVDVRCRTFDVDVCPAIANALMLAAFILCYVLFALLSLVTYPLTSHLRSSMSNYQRLYCTLLLVYVSRTLATATQ